MASYGSAKQAENASRVGARIPGRRRAVACEPLPKRRPPMGGESREKSPLWSNRAENADFSFRDAKNRDFSRQSRAKNAPIGGLARRRPGKMPERPQGDPQKTRTRGPFSCEKSRFSSALRPLEDERAARPADEAQRAARGRRCDRGFKAQHSSEAAWGGRKLGLQARDRTQAPSRLNLCKTGEFSVFR